MSFWNSGYCDLIDSIFWGFLACNFSCYLAQEKTYMCHLPYVVRANQFLDLSCYKYPDSKMMWCPCKWTVDISSHCICLCQTSTSAQAVGYGGVAFLLACPFAQKSVQLLSSYSWIWAVCVWPLACLGMMSGEDVHLWSTIPLYSFPPEIQICPMMFVSFRVKGWILRSFGLLVFYLYFNICL